LFARVSGLEQSRDYVPMDTGLVEEEEVGDPAAPEEEKGRRRRDQPVDTGSSQGLRVQRVDKPLEAVSEREGI